MKVSFPFEGSDGSSVMKDRFGIIVGLPGSMNDHFWLAGTPNASLAAFS